MLSGGGGPTLGEWERDKDASSNVPASDAGA